MLPHKQTRLVPRVVHMTSAHSAFDSRVFHKECVTLAASGYEVIELTNHAENVSKDGVQVYGLGRSRGRLHRFAKSWKMLLAALQLDADMYHFHDPELLPCGVLLRAFGKNVIYDIHEDLPRTVSYKRYIPRWCRAAAAVAIEAGEDLFAFCMSGLVAATPTIGKRFRRLNSRTVVVSNFPIEDELVSPAATTWQSRDRAIVYIGGISEERGIFELLSAVEHCSSSPAPQLHLAGLWFDGSLQQKAQSTRGWKSVTWHGMLDRQGVRDLLSRARAGLVVLHPEPNFVCSQPIKLFEYMAAGIPVIASDFPLWRQIIEESGCGILVDPSQPHEIAAAIDHLITNQAEAERMGRNGRAAVEQRFNWSREKTTLLDFYRALIGDAAPAMSAEGSHAEA